MNSTDITQELGYNFMVYAIDTNNNKSFPNARDGLKPGQRACLWAMYKAGFSSNKPHVKSAKIDGLVAANYWPHGTTAIYETFARMSQPFTNNIPEIDFHGANGNVIIGADAVAADRYSEARLSRIAEDGMLYGINKDNVDMMLNFSEDEKWPKVLPAIFPRLLVNGAQGIGVGIATEWTLHNLQETARVLIDYIKNDSVDNDTYYPDFPTGATIVNKNELAVINKTGKGKILVEAKYTISQREIEFTEFPFQVYIEPVIEEIKKCVESGKITGIKEVNNKSDKKRTLLSIACTPYAEPEKVLSQLFQYTSLRKQYNINQMAIVSKTPILLTLEDMCRIYKEHNLSCIKREHQFDLTKTLDRIEILEGLERAYSGIDAVINLMKSSKSSAEAKAYMIDNLGLTERQTQAILDLKLSRLAHLEKEEILKELADKRELAKSLQEIVGSEKKQIEILIYRLTELAKKYGSPRRTQVIQKEIVKETSKSKKEKVVEDVVIALTSLGYIKSIPAAKFRPNGSVREERATTEDTIVLFSSLGKFYRIKASAIKQCLNSEKGTAIGAIIPLEQTEKIVDFAVCGKSKNMAYFCTKMGKVKKFDIEDTFGTTQNFKGISIIKLAAGDELVSLELADDAEEFFIVTNQGWKLRASLGNLSVAGKASSGRKGINLHAGDYVIESHVLKRGASSDIPQASIGTRGKQA